ncbi:MULTISPECIES: VTT domain-containing protein [Actinosynnema]|uniref:DedA family protein n=1 Tax=Actinosynnema TaxID=40566 RepID=UPI0020A34275|nr:VTT domain-containing protein [Actinosynnema pretiosum]MCP2096567.1 membrane protein DedA, SNARE-associated domain [Actinosynnema pretiosum]
MHHLTAVFDVVLRSAWLLPVLALLIALDAPVPVLPSETLLVAAASGAFHAHDASAVLGLAVTAMIGSVLGDFLVYGLGRGSHRLLRVPEDAGPGGWVRRNLTSRPVVVCVGARLLPGGRLVSTAACGRVGLPVRRFLPATLAASAVWSAYMLAFGALLGPLTHGHPLLSLAAGLLLSAVTAGGFELARRVFPRALASGEAEPLAVGAAGAGPAAPVATAPVATAPVPSAAEPPRSS